MKLHGKVLDLGQLEKELTAAKIPFRALTTFEGQLFTYNEEGQPVELPREAERVVKDHIPLPPPPGKNEILLQLLTSMDSGPADPDLIKNILKEMLTP